MSPLLLGLYLGVIASVTLVGVFVYAIQRDRAYLWYVVFQVGTASHVLVSDVTGVGVLEGVGVVFADVHQFLRPFSAGMMLLGTVMFAATFLHTARRVPLGHWFLIGLASYAVGLMALSLLGLGNTAGRPLRYLGVLAPVAILVVGWTALRRGSREALFYLLGQGAFGLGVFAQALAALRSTDVDTAVGLAFGSIAEAALLSLALVQRSLTSRRSQAALAARLERQGRLASLGQLMAGIGHEIRNPNGFICFNLPLVERTVQAIEPTLLAHAEEHPGFRIAGREVEAVLDDTFRLIEHMKHGSQRISALADELRGFSRGAVSPVPVAVALAPIVERALVLTRPELEARGVRVESDFPAELPDVSGWPERLEQVVINLVLNAAQAADKQEPWLRIRAAVVGTSAVLIVEDNGRGIPAEKLGSIFEPFFTLRDGGSGLGLTICNELVLAMGGSIEVRSDHGRGAKFTVRLALATAEELVQERKASA